MEEETIGVFLQDGFNFNIVTVGDWVEIVCPDKPWFHGEIGEVIAVRNIDNPIWAMAEIALSKTPGHPITQWLVGTLRRLPLRAVEVLGEDYFE